MIADEHGESGIFTSPSVTFAHDRTADGSDIFVRLTSCANAIRGSTGSPPSGSSTSSGGIEGPSSWSWAQSNLAPGADEPRKHGGRP